MSFGKTYYVNRFSGAKRQKVLTSDTFYYVPLMETLNVLLTDKDVQKLISTPHYSQNKLADFCDASVYKSHPLFSSDDNALQIIGYYDELEVCNPLGSYVSTHKLGCLFFTLGNIPPRFRSTFNAIFLVAVAHSQDIAEYGLDAFLSPFVNDLKTLYLDGITVSIDGKQSTYYGGLLVGLADNLAAHALGGFKESHSFSLRICRTCMITTEQAQSAFTENDCQLRTCDEHEEQCHLLSGALGSHFSTTYGINRRSILEDVPGYSVITGLPHDIMHDLFEGAVGYELKLLIQHCVKSHYFSIHELNGRITRFDFDENRPTLIDPLIVRDSDRKLRQSASQMITLSCSFPMLVGDKVPRDDKCWKSFLLLLEISGIVLAPVITHDTIAYLRILIEEKLSSITTQKQRLYQSFITWFIILPKWSSMAHLLIHGPCAMRRSLALSSKHQNVETSRTMLKLLPKNINFGSVINCSVGST